MKNEQEFPIAQYLNPLSRVATDSLYVVDLLQKQFGYIKPNDLFLCGYSMEEVLKNGYDFYEKIVHPEDLPLWKEICETVMQYLNVSEDKCGEIDHFSCTFRLQRKYSFFTPHPLPQMICHKMVPYWADNKLRYLICSARISTAGKAGSLQVHNTDMLKYKEFNFNTRHWVQRKKIQLTEREKVILMLAKQAKSVKEIAYILRKGEGTIRNHIKRLFSKLSVNSMQEAIDFVRSHEIIH
jgi:DNA-binding CsgD family transcriptional regulator